MSIKNRIVSLAAILVIALTLAACGGDNGTPGSGGGNANMSNADLLKTAANNMKSAKSYHMDADVTAGTTAVKFNGDIDLTNKNLRLNTSASGMDIQIVVVGSDAYLSSDGGKTFTKSPDASSMTSSLDQFTKMWDSFNAADIDKAKDQIKDGSPATETIAGTTCKHMTANAKDIPSLNAAGSGASFDGTIDIWTATDGSIVCQEKVAGTSSGSDLKATITWSNVNKPVDIKAPPTSN